MEEIIACSICEQQFDKLISIPRVLECGHTFCSPCITKVIEGNPDCPKCRASIKEKEGSLPINYSILEMVDTYKSAKSERELITSVNVMKERCMDKKDILSKKKSHISSSLEVLDKCLERLEQLTASESHNIDTEDARKILSKVEEDLKKADDVIGPDDIKSCVSISSSSFDYPEEYLIEIYKRVENKEKVFSVHKIEDEIKYGEVSVYENKLFFHSLTLSEVPKDSSLLWFDELKECVNKKNFFTFIKILYNEKNVTRILIIKTMSNVMSQRFIAYCTGEFGACCKGAIFDNLDFGDRDLFLSSGMFTGVCPRTSRVIYYNLYKGQDEDDEEIFKYEKDQMFIYMPNRNGFFIVIRKETFDGHDIIGKIISPMKLNKDFINFGDKDTFPKIVECGIILEV